MTEPPFLVDAMIVGTSAEGGEKADARTVVTTLVARLAAGGHLAAESVSEVVEAVLKREEAFSTGIGAGIAVPHARTTCVPRLVGILGLCRRAVDFHSLDGEPTDVVLLLLTPPPTPHAYQSMRTPKPLERTCRQFANDEFMRQLRGVSSDAELYEILMRDIFEVMVPSDGG